MKPEIKIDAPRWAGAMCYCCGDTKDVRAIVIGHDLGANRGNSHSINVCRDCREHLVDVLVPTCE